MRRSSRRRGRGVGRRGGEGGGEERATDYKVYRGQWKTGARPKPRRRDFGDAIPLSQRCERIPEKIPYKRVRRR
ncbi:hypothetical protein HZH66_006571 [Vespula vulgaris]|uniref:Uncharacterized protein n=1 Tax=Vespula vulgaris TaxID=7454 RepID=A0A834N8D4_VESVU|nr:hypothetical protein HZH66_006571 [Vespula vulgaris]